MLIYKTGWANKYLSTVNAMSKTANRIMKEYSKYVGKAHFEKYDKPDMSNTIWFCWLQGIENAPELVKHCFESIKYHITDMDIILLDENNLFDYISMPEYIIDKWKAGVITNTHFSDLIRVNILNSYGGLWLDSTVYLTSGLPDYITGSDFFVYRNGWFDDEMINMGSWLIYSKPGNILLTETENLLNEYWREHNYLRQYFLLHIFFRMVSEKYPDEWEKVPYYNHIDAHILAQEMGKTFSQERFEQIKAITPVHKLTNKTDEIVFEKGSYYSMLGELYKL